MLHVSRISCGCRVADSLMWIAPLARTYWQTGSIAAFVGVTGVWMSCFG
jgi:hypothetical protein